MKNQEPTPAGEEPKKKYKRKPSTKKRKSKIQR
jgi:hypothetical protein